MFLLCEKKQLFTNKFALSTLKVKIFDCLVLNKLKKKTASVK